MIEPAQLPRKTALYPVLAVESPSRAAAEFQRLLPLETVFQTDWYQHLRSTDDALQIGFVRRDHDSVPPDQQTAAQGVFITVDSADASADWDRLKDEFDIAVPLTDEDWGQRHFIVRLSSGLMVDVVELL